MKAAINVAAHGIDFPAEIALDTDGREQSCDPQVGRKDQRRQ
jgi:hypothetical protein